MTHGGKRPGAGRPKGVPNKRTAKTAAEVEASGLTPLDYMLSLMRNEKLPPDARFEAAKAAAPYVHAKLASIEHQGDVTQRIISHTPMSAADWADTHGAED